MRETPPRGDKESRIHRVQEFTLERVNLPKDYAVIRTLGEGCFAKVLLATHRRTNTTVVLKSVHTEMTVARDFFREFHYSYHLSAHPNVLSVYDVAFRADDYYVFAEEYAPLGDLAGNVKAGGLPEESCKLIAKQLAFALEFLHSKELVHRDLKLENVLVFAPDMSKVKLCDFGSTRRHGSLVSKVRCTWHQFLSPEVCEVVWNERYHCHLAADVWQLGVVIFVCLTGHPPWQAADSIADPAYSAFFRWQRRRTTKIPAQFKRFTPRALRLFKRLFEHKPEGRAKVTEINKYLKDPWLVAGKASGSGVAASSTEWWRKDSVNMYLHQNEDGDRGVDDGKLRLKKTMSSYGLETTIDQKVMTKRIWEWVLSTDVQQAPAVDVL